MKLLHVSRWFITTAVAAVLPNTMQNAVAHGMAGGMSGGHGGMWMGSQSFSSREFGHFGHPHNFRFRRQDRDHFFSHHHNRFFFAFDFAAFGFPWWYPYPYPYSYDNPYPYPDYTYSSYSYDYGAGYDYRYWKALAVSVQSKLALRGYYHGPVDGMIGADSRQAIREFQAANGLPVTGQIDPKLLKTLGVNYRTPSDARRSSSTVSFRSRVLIAAASPLVYASPSFISTASIC